MSESLFEFMNSLPARSDTSLVVFQVQLALLHLLAACNKSLDLPQQPVPLVFQQVVQTLHGGVDYQLHFSQSFAQILSLVEVLDEEVERHGLDFLVLATEDLVQQEHV